VHFVSTDFRYNSTAITSLYTNNLTIVARYFKCRAKWS